MYILEYNGIPAGCIAITHTEQSTAQLRFFFIEAELRGKGAGHQLIDLALNFCFEKKYKHVFYGPSVNCRQHGIYMSKRAFESGTHVKTATGDKLS